MFCQIPIDYDCLWLGSKDVPTVILSFNQDGSLTEEETPLIHNLQILDSDEAQLNFLEGKYRTSFKSWCIRNKSVKYMKNLITYGKSTISCLFVYKHLCLL